MTNLIVFIISFATILLELAFTKILAFAFWNHIVYLIISIALLGYGIGSNAVLLYTRSYSQSRENRIIPFLLLGFSASIFGSLEFLSYASRTYGGIVDVPLLLIPAYAIFTLPFIFGGAVLVWIFQCYPMNSNRLYFWDLCGASLGAILFAPLLYSISMKGVVVFTSVIPIVISAALFLPGMVSRFSLRESTPFFVLIVICLLGMMRIGDSLDLKPTGNKSLSRALDIRRNPTAHQEASVWDPVTRFDVVDPGNDDLDIGWTHIRKGVKLITFDGDAISMISRLDAAFPNEKEMKQYAASDFQNLVLGEKGRSGNHLIIGLGGGPDISNSLLGDAHSITAVDINRSLLEQMSSDFASYSGNIFNRSNVRLIHSEGRSYLHRRLKINEKFDLIQMTGVDTFTALNTGAYTLAENHLYTVEAIKDYYTSLSQDGVLSIHRWFYDDRPRETFRLFATIFQALREMGISNPEKHVAVIRSTGAGITYLRKKPFSIDESAHLFVESQTKAINGARLKVVYLPNLRPSGNHQATPYFQSFSEAFSHNLEQPFYERYLYDIRPSYDDKPFFFNYYKIRDIFSGTLSAVLSTGPIQGYWPYIVMVSIFVGASIAVAAFIVVPLFLFAKDGIRENGTGWATLYFISVGMGFIMIEIAMMQKLALLLGHPSYSIAVVLGGLLAFSGIGSFITGRVNLLGKPDCQLWLVLTLIIYVVLFLIFGDSVTGDALALNLPGRILVALVVIAPIGLVLGVFFPLGLRFVSRWSPQFIPWAWGVNSGFTVIGSVAAIALAMWGGFSVVLLLACLFYIAAALSLRRLDSWAH